MNTSQNFRARVPPSRVPTGGAPIKHSSLIGSNRPEVLAGRANLLKSQQQAEANTNVSQYPAQSSEHENKKDQPSTTPEGIINNEDDRKIEPVLTSEEPEIKPKKQFSESRRAEDENEDETEVAGNDEHTSQDLLTLSQSLKAMKSLRDNFKSFEYGMEEDADQQNQSERVYKEVDEEDYVKVESEEQINEYDEEEEVDPEAQEEYEDEYPQDQEQDYRGSARSMRDQYIEKIHEKSQREEDDEEEEEQPVEDNEPRSGSNTNVFDDPGENLQIGQKSAQVSVAKNDPEESAGLRHQKQEDIPSPMARSIQKSPMIKEATPKLNKSAGLRHQEQEDIPPPIARQIEKSPMVKDATPKLNKSAGLRNQEQEDIPPQMARQVEKSPMVKEATPKLNKETTPKNNVESEKNRFLDELEYGDIKTPQVVEEELPPPIPKPTGSHMASPFGVPGGRPKSQAVKAEVGKKSNEGPFGARQPFVTSVRQEESNVSVQSPYRERAIESVGQHHQQHSSESNDNTYLIRLKQIEIELAKERKKNECLEAEREGLLTETKSLKQENAEVKANLDDLKRNRDIEKLAQKEQDAIGKLREELKSTVENSRLIAEHSNRVIDENVKYKQDMEGIVTTLEDERDRLQQNITELNNQLRDERLKIENLQQRAESFERKAQEYEESFDLIQKQLKERMEAFQKLVSLNDEAQTTLQSLPKVEELLAKLQPRNQTTSVQTSQVLSPPKPIIRTMKDDYPSFEGKANFNKSESSTRKSQQSEENIIRKSQQTAEPVVRKSQQTIEPLVLNSQLIENPSNKKPEFKSKTPFMNAESAISLDQTIQKNNSSLRSEKNTSIKSDTDFVFSPNFNQTYSKLTSSVLTEEAREEGKKPYRAFDAEEDLSLLVGNQTLLEMVATPQTAKPVKKDPFKTEGIHAQKDKSSDVESPIIRREVAQEALVKKPVQIRPNFGSKTTPKSSSIKKEITREEVLHSPQNLEDTMRHRNPMTEHSGDWGLEDSLVSASSLNKSAQPQETEKEKKPVLSNTKPLEITTQPKTITFAHAEPSPKIQTPKIETPKTTVQESKPEPTALKPVFSLPPGKSKVPSFVKQPSTDETKTKELILGRTVSGSQEKSSATSDKPNFGSSQNKGGLRYAQPKKNIDKNLISVEADNFFDELGLSDVSVGKGANPLRESATSLRSNASRQSQTVVKKKN